MSSAFNHKSRSRKTYKSRMAAARYNCSYNFTREERLMAQARLAALMHSMPTSDSENKNNEEVE